MNIDEETFDEIVKGLLGAVFLLFAGVCIFAPAMIIEVLSERPSPNIEMTPGNIAEILAEHKTWLDSNGENGAQAVAYQHSLIGVNLAGADLRHALLGKNDMQLANFSAANLMNANFKFSNLRGVIFQGTNLQEANLFGAKLQGANIRNANLAKANLSYASLQGADLTDADLRGADLQGADFEGANLTRADLRGADLHKAYFWNAVITDTVFTDAVIMNAEPNDTSDAGAWSILADML